MPQTAGGAATRAGPERDAPYRVMVVDDSAVIRGLLTRALEQDSAISVVASVGNGQLAINALGRQAVDVIVLDIEMPVMDGLTAIPKLLAVTPSVKIIVASTLTRRNADISLRALRAGAADYLPKPTTREISGTVDFRTELVTKVKGLAEAARRDAGRGPGGRGRAEVARAGVPRPIGAPPVRARLDRFGRPDPTAGAGGAAAASSPAPASAPSPGEPAAEPPPGLPPAEVRAAAVPFRQRPPAAPIRLRPASLAGRPAVIAIGSSTGGPQALFEVVSHLKGVLTQPLLVTQHMPPTFTTILAEHMTRQCGVPCAEAKDGELVVGGRGYIAPGDHHMLVEPRGGGVVTAVNRDAPENFCRPAVDPMLRSVVRSYGRSCVALILTGMGQDGLKGCEAVVAAGGLVIGQDEATSVVWGMPGAVATAGLCSAVLPLGEIGPYVRKVATGAAA